MAQTERRGIPIDLALLTTIRKHWDGMRLDLVAEMDQPFGCYEIIDGRPHWRREWFKAYTRRNGMSWPILAASFAS